MPDVAALLPVINELSLSGRSVPDLGRLLLAVLSASGVPSGQLVLTPDGDDSDHEWACEVGSGSVRYSQPGRQPADRDDVVLGGPGVPFGYVRLSGGGPRRRRDASDLIRQVTPVLRIGLRALESNLALARAVRDGGQISDLRLRAAADFDAQRRRLERDLHDGAQNELVALKMTTAVLGAQLASGQRDAALESARQLDARLAESERNLSGAASGIAPAHLIRGGLLASLRVAVPADADVVFVEPGEAPRRYPVSIELAAHYICLESINNALKHAGGSQIVVTVVDSYVGLEVAVADSGPGLSPQDGSGSLHYLSDRAAAAGGTLSVTSSPAGTTIRASFPL